jgi:hypothetical protein
MPARLMPPMKALACLWACEAALPTPVLLLRVCTQRMKRTPALVSRSSSWCPAPPAAAAAAHGGAACSSTLLSPCPCIPDRPQPARLVMSRTTSSSPAPMSSSRPEAMMVCSTTCGTRDQGLTQNDDLRSSDMRCLARSAPPACRRVGRLATHRRCGLTSLTLNSDGAAVLSENSPQPCLRQTVLVPTPQVVHASCVSNSSVVQVWR